MSHVAIFGTQTTPGDTAIKVDSSGNLKITDATSGAAAALADATANPTTSLVGALLEGYNGATWDRVRVANVQKDLSAVSINSIATVWTPASGKKVRIMGGTFSSSTAISVLFEDNAGGTTVFRTPKLLTDTPYNFVVNGGQGYLLAAANNVLKATGSGNGSITGTLWGTEE